MCLPRRGLTIPELSSQIGETALHLAGNRNH